MKTAVFTAATKSYAYALRECAEHLARGLKKHKDEFLWVIATDSRSTIDEAVQSWERFGVGEIKVIETGVEECEKKYKERSQLVISMLQQACMDESVKWGAELFFSVESDILIHPDSYATLKWVLEYPSSPGYDIAAATYFNGAFLCGRGTPQYNICEDFSEEERKVPKKLKDEISSARKQFKNGKGNEDLHKKFSELMEELKKIPPKGNVFWANSKKWRKRGWLDAAYPGAACQGSVLPTDWCGLGCTLWGKDVMDITNFTGYDGRGTQDLFLVWNKWRPAWKRIGCPVGVPAGHVKINEGKKFLWEPYFVQPPEETEGHIRVRQKPLEIQVCELNSA